MLFGTRVLAERTRDLFAALGLLSMSPLSCGYVTLEFPEKLPGMSYRDICFDVRLLSAEFPDWWVFPPGQDPRFLLGRSAKTLSHFRPPMLSASEFDQAWIELQASLKPEPTVRRVLYGAVEPPSVLGTEIPLTKRIDMDYLMFLDERKHPRWLVLSCVNAEQMLSIFSECRATKRLCFNGGSGNLLVKDEPDVALDPFCLQMDLPMTYPDMEECCWPEI